MPPPIFIEMTSFSPDGGDFGPDLALVKNVLPMHGGWQPLREKQTVASVTDGPMRGAYVHVYQQTVQVQESGAISDDQQATWLAPIAELGDVFFTLYDMTDEVFPSDSDFIYAVGAPTQVAPLGSAIFNLPVWADPASGSNHLYRWRYRILGTVGAWSLQLELADIPLAVTSITRAGATATATMAAAHGWATNQVVYITGAGQIEYNIRTAITVTGATTFTFAVAGTPASPATGTIVARAVWKSDTASGTGPSGTGFTQREAALTAGEANAITAAGYGRFKLILTAVVAGSAQFGRPIEDLELGGWLNNLGSGVNLYLSIDETVASDADYLKSSVLAQGGAIDLYAAQLTELEDPITGVGFNVRYRLRGSNAGVKAVVRLKCGATLIKEATHTNVATSFAAQTMSLTTTEWDSVTDPEDLNLEAEASWPAAATSTVFQGSAPENDVSNVGWSPSTGAFLFPCIDESSPSDADFITALSATSNIVRFDVEDAIDPGTDADHKLEIRASSPLSESLIVRLISGGITVKAWDFSSIAEGPLTTSLATYTLTLTSGEGSTLVYNDFHVEIEGIGAFAGQNAVVSYLRLFTPERRWAELSWAEIETPSPAHAEVSWMRVSIPGVAEAYRGDVPTIYSGSLTKLYEVDSGGFEDISDSAGYGAGASPGFWRFCSAGNNTIATNRADPVQIRLANAGDFEDCITSTLTPKARFAAMVRNHLVLADINLTDHFPDEIWWSYFDDVRNFDNAPQGQGGFQRVVSRPGQIMGLVGGDYGVIFKRNSMHLLGWQGGILPFRIDDISATTGTPLPTSIVQTPYGVFWFDGATFRRYLGGVGDESLQDIGNAVLSQFLTDSFSEHNILNLDPTEIYDEDALMVGWWDTSARMVCWSYQHVRVEESIARHTHTVKYNPQEDRWSFGLFDAEVAGRGIPGIPPLWASCWASLPNTQNTHTHLLKGTIGFSWDGSDSSWFRFDGPSTYEGFFTSKRRALGIEGVPEEERAPKAARLTGLMPIFTHRPDASVVPNIAATVTVSNDPYFVDDVRSKTASLSLGSQQKIIPIDITGTWFKFEATIPRLTAQDARLFKGFYAFWDWAGTPGSR